MGECNCKNGNTGPRGYCVECDITQMARNNYFTGKLLVERDFTDEQRYSMGKLRRHNQRLHGWGAVCGLKVVPHPACPDRFVIIEPGTAIDCCGREILVTHEEYFDFKSQFLANWPKQKGPDVPLDDKPHRIQICVSYNECPTEDVPALFDDCSCTSATCQPNRILESYAFDVLIDPPRNNPDAPGVKVDWECTVGITNVVRVANNDATKRLFVLTSDAAAKTAALYIVDATTKSIQTSQTFAKNIGLDVAVSSAGDFVYLALKPNAGAPNILVLKTADLGTTINTLKPGGAPVDVVRLAVVPAPDDRLLAVFPSAGVFIWDTDIQTNPPLPAAPKSPAVGNQPVALAVSEGSGFVYVANSADSTISAIELSNLNVTSVNTSLGGSSPSAIAVASTTIGDKVAVLDSTHKKLFLISIPSVGPGSAAAIGTVTGFSFPPIDLQISDGGRWIYVLEKDGAAPHDGYIQVVDEHVVELAGPNVLDTATPVGIQPVQLLLSEDGSRLYVPYDGDRQTVSGAVAVVNISQSHCADLFDCALEPCPDCDSGNCLVLATIEEYVYNQPVTGPEIDNRTDRHLLLSTEILTKLIRCLLDQGGGGGTGPQGPPGPTGPQGPQGNDGVGLPGPAGSGITDVNVTFVPCNKANLAGASLRGNAPNFTLDLTIPGPCNPNLPVISTINWDHNGSTSVSQLRKHGGLRIAFSEGMQVKDLTLDTVMLLIPIQSGNFEIVAEVTKGIKIQPVNFAQVGNVNTNPTPVGAGLADGVIIQLNEKILEQMLNPDGADAANLPKLRVCVRGDFIRDKGGVALDGDHLPGDPLKPWVASAFPPVTRSGDGIEGGTFESWFTLKPE